jgi:hypothetical protein
VARGGGLALLVACRASSSDSPSVEPQLSIEPRAETEARAPESKRPEAAAPLASAPPANTASAAAPASPANSATPAADFEDEFAYGSDDDDAKNTTASAASVAALRAGKTTYRRYDNGRFGFGLDVPGVFRPMPEPTNGDGMQYRVGKLAVMTASGTFWDEKGFDGTCPASDHVTARKEIGKTCFATGKAHGFIFWERDVITHGVMFSLRFQYVESLKDAMDPIVTHVNASWTF